MTIIVTNIKTTFVSMDALNVYIGREFQSKVYYRKSPLANMYRIGRDGTREEVLAQYRIWLIDMLQDSMSSVSLELEVIKQFIVKGKSINLRCWCAPLPCHGDIIKKYLETGKA